jgi:hypothetical protein
MDEKTLQELRQSALDEDLVTEYYEEYLAGEVHSDKMFGMTAVERMFVSVGCFIITTLGGVVLLLIMDKIQI